jgi:hypothetical protein
MDSIVYLPDLAITDVGPIASKFMDLGVHNFKDACIYVHNLEYGYNSNPDDQNILFKENKGSCTTKHATIAGLAEEMQIPLYKTVGIYKFTEEIVEGASKILTKYNLPFVPMVHCFLVYEKYRFDLTEGNYNGKKSPIEEFLYTEQVDAFISRKKEYLLYKKALKEILLTPEMKGIEEKSILKAREEAIHLLKKKIL